MVVVLEPGVFWLGERDRPSKEGDFMRQARRKHRIRRIYAISAKEVTVQQFLRFRKNHQLYRESAHSRDCPVNGVTWYDAAAYCNWLSEREGIPRDQWCYEPNAKGEYAEGMNSAANYLQRTGYRLPTESEWEYACRAGAETGFSFGDAEDLLGRYARFYGNSSTSGQPDRPPYSSQPVGGLRPNDLGLFDMHGNVWEWCQGSFHKTATERVEENSITEDIEDLSAVTNGDSHVWRGGSFLHRAWSVGCAGRYRGVSTDRNGDVGFRTARTLPLGSFTALPPTAEGGRK
jgi:formylglycine-generating enzyme required for sulfatase activity